MTGHLQDADLKAALCSAKLFASHPLPDKDPFTPLLARYLPRPTSTSRPDAAILSTAELISLGRWQALANRTAEEILACRNASDSSDVLKRLYALWTTRLTCLRRSHHLASLASESAALFNLLPPLYTLRGEDGYSSTSNFLSDVPFELVLLQATLPCQLRGDPQVAIGNLQSITYACKLEYRQTKDIAWQEKLTQTGMALINVLSFAGEDPYTSRLLRDLTKSITSMSHASSLFLLALDMGDRMAASAALKTLRSLDPPGQELALFEIVHALFEGSWDNAAEKAKKALQSWPNDHALKENLAVCCMYTGKIQEGIELLESLARSTPGTFYSNETSISNLITLQELQAGDQLANKLDLLSECSRYANEGLSLSCFRL